MLRKLAIFGTAVAMPLALLVPGSGAAATKVDVSQDTIQCNTVIATAGIKPPLTNASGVALQITIKGSLTGCTVSGPNAATVLSGTISGKLTSTSSGCAGLLGSSPVSGNITIKWKADKTTPLLQTSSVVAASSLTGGLFNGPAGEAHGQFTLDASGATGAFLGNDGGASSNTIAATSEDVGTLAGGCAGAGIKTIHLGMGQVNVQ